MSFLNYFTVFFSIITTCVHLGNRYVRLYVAVFQRNWQQVMEKNLGYNECNLHQMHLFLVLRDFNHLVTTRITVSVVENISHSFSLTSCGPAEVVVTTVSDESHHRLLWSQLTQLNFQVGAVCITLQQPITSFRDLTPTQTQQTTKLDVTKWALLCQL